jgi:beta-lactamase regulating signal transducer with metallopeptidase domain
MIDLVMNLLISTGWAALALKATVALLITLLLLRIARHWPASRRHLLAAAVFGFLLLLPIAAVLAPARTIEVKRSRIATARPETSSPTIPTRVLVARRPGARSAPLIPDAPAEDRRFLLPLFYLAGVLFFSASLASALWRLVRLRACAEVSVTGTRLANEIERCAGRRGGIEVLMSREVTVPMTFGFLRSAILLPATTNSWSEDEMIRALLHELEHIRRFDWLTQIGSRLVCVFYWPHPLVWVAWRRLCLEAERSCDDAVIRGTREETGYAEQLVMLARSLARRPVPALSMATRSNLGQRVASILDPGARRTPLSRGAFLTATALALFAVLGIAPIRIANAAFPNEEPALSEHDADPLDVALLKAAGRGNLASMIRVLDAGANVNAMIDGDGTPLIVAARQGHFRGVQLLLERGADVNLAVSGDGNPLIMASREGHVEIVELLLDRGALIDEVVPGDENPLIEASRHGQFDVVKLLIARGANVHARVWVDYSDHARKGEWRTPLSMARRGGHDEVVKLLRASGAVE